MSESCISVSCQGAPLKRNPAVFLRACCWVAIALLVGLVPAKADEQEDAYLRIYQNIQQADSLDAAGKTADALSKYQQAYSDLVKFRKAYPSWNTDIVSFRLNYTAQKAAACNEKLNAAAAASGSGGSTTNTAAQPQTQAQATARAAPSAEEPPVVTLLEPGAEPRKVLRFHPKAGDKQTIAFTVTTTMERKTEGNAQAEAMKAPPLFITLENTVKDVSADGDISYENVITEAAAGEAAAGSQQGIAAAMNAAFSHFKGLTTSGVLSSRGFSKRRDAPRTKSGAAAQVPVAARLLQGQMEVSLTMLTAPLPEEAVGAGGKWEVTMTDRSMGLAKAVYEIVSMEQERVAAKVTVSISGNPADTTQNPASGKMKIEGTGEVTIELTRILPSEGNLTQTMDFGAAGGGPAQGVSARVVTNLRIQTK